MQKTILIADDSDMNREILAEMLEDDYNIIAVTNGKEVLETLDNNNDNKIAAILLDLTMPVMDGFEVLEEMEKRDLLVKIPVLIITAEQGSDVELHCFNYSIYDFIKKPYNINIVKKRIGNAIEQFGLKNNLEEQVQEQSQQIIKQNKQLNHVNEEMIELIGSIVESRNNESGDHIQRVKGFTKIIANHLKTHHPELGLNNRKVGLIIKLSPLHDIGKIKISDSILCKPGRLNQDEWQEMKKHTLYGVEILNHIPIDLQDEEFKNTATEIIKCHHERCDGKGYPEGLKEKDIPLSAQIVALADVYDALVSERVYKKAIPLDKAYDMIQNGECGVFSNLILDAFTKCREEMEALANNNKSGGAYES